MNTKQKNRNTSMICKWLIEQGISLDETGEEDRQVIALIDEYVRLMDAIEYWGDEPKAEDEAFMRLLKHKEQEILHMLSSDKN